MARILYVSQSYSTHDHRFLELLVRSEHEVWFLPCAPQPAQIEAQPIPAGIHSLPPLCDRNCRPFCSEWVRAAMRFYRIMKVLRPDLVHAGPVQTGGFFAAVSGVHPLLIASWGSDVLSAASSSFRMEALAKFTLRRADMALGDCEAVRGRISTLGLLAPQKIICFPWGICQSDLRAKARILGLRKIFGWEECKVVASARAFEASHGTMNFVHAMAGILNQRPDVRVLMLGDGSLMRDVRAYVQSHRIADKFHLAGWVPEDLVPDYFAEADLYVSAAPCDGSSISLLQAMGCGLPAVVADAGGNREWVKRGENGWLHVPGNIGALVNATRRALDCISLWPAMGRANINTVKMRANWEENSQQLLITYDKLLKPAHAKEADADAELQNR